jgi:putative ABC transport system ATP-binding protein
MAYIEFNDIVKSYQMGEVSIQALDHAQFEIEQGELVCILGPSGAGKTTALNILGGMDGATSGQVLVDGVDITQLKNKALVNYRRNDIGFVFQFYNLIQNLTALENVEMAVQLTKDSFSPAKTLEEVGLGERQKNFPAQLSGGEQQRVAIARALAKNPKLLLCDEPTGALDYHTGKQILSLLVDTCREEKITVIVITHNSAIGQIADKIIKFKNGRVESIQRNDQPLAVEAIEW